LPWNLDGLPKSISALRFNFEKVQGVGVGCKPIMFPVFSYTYHLLPLSQFLHLASGLFETIIDDFL
jgi:hypothetical protein